MRPTFEVGLMSFAETAKLYMRPPLEIHPDTCPNMSLAIRAHNRRVTYIYAATGCAEYLPHVPTIEVCARIGQIQMVESIHHNCIDP